MADNATKRISARQVHTEMIERFGQIDEKFDHILNALQTLEAAKNTESSRPNPPKPAWMRLGYESEDAWNQTPKVVREQLVKALANNGEQLEVESSDEEGQGEGEIRIRKSNFIKGDSVLKGEGPYQPIIYNETAVHNGRRSPAYDAKVKEMNRLINTRTGRVVQGASVSLSRGPNLDWFSIWNKELARDNRFLWDTPANCEKAYNKSKATGKVHVADSWNAQTRKRRYYRKPDDFLGEDPDSHQGKYDGLVLEMYKPKTGDGWLRVVEYTNPVKKDFVYG